MAENNELIERIAKQVDGHLRGVIGANELIWSRPGGPSNLALNIARAVIDEAPKAAEHDVAAHQPCPQCGAVWPDHPLTDKICRYPACGDGCLRELGQTAG